MTVVSVKTLQLTDAALDWATAQAQKVEVFAAGGKCWRTDKPRQLYSPTSRWRQGGHLLEELHDKATTSPEHQYLVTTALASAGPGQLLASVCRTYVEHVLGPVVSVPAVLLMVSQ